MRNIRKDKNAVLACFLDCVFVLNWMFSFARWNSKPETYCQ